MVSGLHTALIALGALLLGAAIERWSAGTVFVALGGLAVGGAIGASLRIRW